MQAYSDPSRESDPHALPDIEVFQLTTDEVAALDEDTVYEYGKRPEFRMCGICSKTREAMFDAMIEELSITGGWFYQYCFPGCMPDSDPVGPFATAAEATQAAQDEVQS